MKKYYLGIDIGTSSVKVLAISRDGEILTSKCRYSESTKASWSMALKNAAEDMMTKIPLESVEAISVSSQTGTYITDTDDVIHWQSNAGEKELSEIKNECTDDEFVREIGMAHPNMISYPLPRLLYIKRNLPNAKMVIMPKEFIICELTGNTVTDTFSQRGICNPVTNKYSEKLLEKFGIDLKLPDILKPCDLAGHITKNASEKYSLPESTPVYVGCNDFYAGLLGMGVIDSGTVFELSGTSEHIGMITDTLTGGNIISGRYFNGYASYGGTKASGVSCDFAINIFGLDGLSEDTDISNQPIFLPYLKGERAPIFNETARGVFFGITDKTSKKDMAYAVLEGVVFSLYHIYESLNVKIPDYIITGGGSSSDRLMTKLKASLFGCDIVHVEQNESSAMGAAIIAMVANKEFATLESAVKSCVKYDSVTKPDFSLRDKLLKRYEIYKSLFPTLKKQFEDFSKI